MQTNEAILTNLLLGGLLGVLGQVFRVVIGLKKLQEDAVEEGTAAEKMGNPLSTKAIYDQLFDGRKLIISLLIGFAAGCLASLTRDESESFTKDVQLALIAAGYAGTDFIEGIFKKLLPGK